jgi:ketosteroid isomerase-like protein
MTIDTLADRFFAAIEAGEVDTVRELYDPDVEIWHNTEAVAQRRDDNLATLAWMARSFPDLRYTQIRRSATADGFVQQHVLVATNRAGRRVGVPACLVITVRDGRITHLDEYLDSAAVATLLEK